MDFLFNPRIAPSYIVCGSILLLTIGGVASKTRLQTVTYETQNSSISAYRANSCRVLESTDKLVLGGYYFQPNGNGSGQWLNEGTYVCDAYGNSGRIERGGYLQYLIPGDASEMNKTLQTRIAETSNPDHKPELRVRRDQSIKPFVPTTPQQNNETQNQLF